MSTEYRRRPEKQPEVREFGNMANHRNQMIEGHHLAAWAMERGHASAERRAKYIEVRPADNGMYALGVHVIGKVENKGAVLFIVHPGEFLIWENDEFRVYTEKEFTAVFEPLPEVAAKRGLPFDRPTSIAMQRETAEPYLAGRSNQ